MRSHVETAYLREILLQAEYALLAAEGMQSLLGEGLHLHVFQQTHSFLGHAAAVSRVLWPPYIRDEQRRERARDRTGHLRLVLGVPDDHQLKSRTLRDHLEHFDERLDAWAGDTSHGGIVDLHVGPTTFISGPAIERGDFLRVFEPDRKVFTFRGQEFDIQALVDAVIDVATKAQERMAEHAAQQGVAADKARNAD